MMRKDKPLSRLFLIFLILGWVAFGQFVFWLKHSYNAPDYILAILLIGYVFIFGFAAAKRSKFRCPSCGKNFFVVGEGRLGRRINIWRATCANCGVSER